MKFIHRLALGLSGLGLVVALPVQASEQTPDTTVIGEPEPVFHRSYNKYSTELASRTKSDEQIAYEVRLAAAHKTACDENQMTGCLALGKAYELGSGVEQSRPVAAELYFQACSEGLVEGCTALAQLYEGGLDSASASDALQVYEQACAMGSLSGCRGQARMLAQDERIAMDPVFAEGLMAWTCESGDEQACLAYSDMLLRSDRSAPDRHKALELLMSYCEKDSLEACTQGLTVAAGSGYYGQGLGPRFAHFACAYEDAQSCVDMGQRSFAGEGLAPDLSRALAYYDRACSLNEIYCSVAQSIRAEDTYLVSCDYGDATACGHLGRAYGAMSSPISNVEWEQHFLSYACENGALEFCHDAAEALMSGSYEPRSPRFQRGVEFLYAGCEFGDVEACTDFGMELYRGETIAEDKLRAVELLVAQCNAEHELACVELDKTAFIAPEGSLAEADSRFEPPIERDEDGTPTSDFLSEEERELMARSCVSSEVEFRGKIYRDQVCRLGELALNSYRLRPGQAPWQALLWRPPVVAGQSVGRAQRVLCGGSVIRRGWILTAAHCLRDQNQSIVGKGYRVRLGVYNPRKDEGISYPIEQVFIHPFYVRRTYAYDIALVKYDPNRGRKDGPSNRISTIRLDPLSVDNRSIAAGANVYSYGWGWTGVSDSSSTDYLQGVKLQLQSRDDCTRTTKFRGRYRDSALCAAGRDGAQSCWGDSGGPLITYSDPGRKPTLLGVVSWGRKCGTTGSASAFTRVGKVSIWLNRIMASNP